MQISPTSKASKINLNIFNTETIETVDTLDLNRVIGGIGGCHSGDPPVDEGEKPANPLSWGGGE